MFNLYISLFNHKAFKEKASLNGTNNFVSCLYFSHASSIFTVLSCSYYGYNRCFSFWQSSYIVESNWWIRYFH